MTRGRKTHERVVRDFWSRVSKGPECWEWNGAKNASGYGNMSYMGKTVIAHRFAWFLVHGEWSQVMVCHCCDNPCCVRIEHLFEGSAADNTADMIAKGRQVVSRGERSSRVKLTETEVRQIRSLAGRLNNRECAELYGVDESAVSRIRQGRRWSHVATEATT